MLKSILFLLSFFAPFAAIAQSNWVIEGTVKDSSGKPVEQVVIQVINSNKKYYTDNSGFYKITFNESEDKILQFSKMNYKSLELLVYPSMDGKRIDIVLDSGSIEIAEVVVSENKARESGLVKLESKLLNSIPVIGGDKLHTLIKTMPGVASGNELSSNYSVRGGNFDENLVYINGIEIFRPSLLQSGQQEGLNMINSDLVSKIEFSSGGFSSVYDDKMSSVLDIRYKQASEFKAGGSLSFLGASAFAEGNHFNRKFSYLTGIRYKNAQYLLGSLETDGEYKPNFIDFQTLLTYNLGKKLSASLLAYYANNNFLFYPEDRSTSFGTAKEALNLYIDFNGVESDNFTTGLGAFTLDYRPASDVIFKFTGSYYRNRESLTYDIEGRYSLNQLDKELGSSTYGDSILNLGIGRFIDHARSYYESDIYSLNWNGTWQLRTNLVQWGLKYQNESFKDEVNEWKLVDSAGYSIPYTNEQIELAESRFSNNALNINRFSAYLNSVYRSTSNFKWHLDYGIRYSFNSLNQEHLLSPRISAGWYPDFSKKLYFRIGTGIYYQSIVFREIIDRQGKLHRNTKTPLSLQYIASVDYDLMMMGRPFHFKSEVYYKSLKRLIPYSVDNIRNIYYPGKDASGYVAGIDFRLNGEFVKDVESWFSLSLMKSGIQISGDTLGTQPLPNDYFLNASLYFQDYLPGNERFKMYMALYYISGKPFGPPRSDTYYAPLRMKAYKRVDIGFSMTIKSIQNQSGGFFNRAFKEILLNIEVFNLLGINNTVSYNWVTVVPNTSVLGNDQYSNFAVPNRLSARRLNLRLSFSF